MEESVASRLKLFIDTSGLTSTQFADMCGVPRPSLSQILSGRNKKVSDVLVGQIHKAFPDLSVMWLLFGEGPVKVSASKSVGGGASSSTGGNSGDSSAATSSSSAGVTGSAGSMSSMMDSQFSDANFSSVSQELRGGVGNGNEYSNLRGLKNADSGVNVDKNQVFESDLKIMDLQRQIEQMRQNPRKVVQITIYYDDSTFETFISK